MSYGDRRGERLAGVLTTSASVRFTVWTNAMLTGTCDPDTAAQKILGDDVGHHVAGLAAHPAPATLPVALNLLRAAGATQAHLALPVPGDPIGLAGPPTFNEAALETGEAVVLHGRRARTGSGVRRSGRAVDRDAGDESAAGRPR